MYGMRHIPGGGEVEPKFIWIMDVITNSPTEMGMSQTLLSVHVGVLETGRTDRMKRGCAVMPNWVCSRWLVSRS